MTHEHEHAATTEFVAPVTPEPSPTSNMEKFIRENPIDMTVFDSMREVNNHFQNACRRIAEDFQRNYETVNTRKDWYIHVARKKLHQGKTWSKGLVNALLLDLESARSKYVKQMEEQVAAAHAAAASTTSTSDNNTPSDDSTASTTN